MTATLRTPSVNGAPSINGAGADVDMAETREWLEALDAVVSHDGVDRARDLLTRGHSSRATTRARISKGRLTEEQLDNLIWVVNCNLQRLDGPVRGNGKIIQEPESDFRGAGWNVIKVIWGSRWDPLLTADVDGALVKVMEDCVDGDYQTFKSRDGAYVRENFFGRDPRLLERVADMSDDEIWLLNRGGHDQQKVYAAYHAAVRHTGQPTVILAKTIKGYGMGVSGEGQMITHQAKKMNEAALLAFRDRFELPLTDQQVRDAEYYTPPADAPEMQFLRERRDALGGALPARRRRSKSLPTPDLDMFKSQLEGTGEREISTTMAFVRVLAALLRDKQLGPHIVPIVPDESRTFGMEGLFRQFGIYSPFGQRYRPQDSEQLMFYKEDAHGQILEEGITEAGSVSSFIAAGTSYSSHDTPTIPFYIYYSMFGYQRVGDLIWAAGDSRTRGFLLGGTHHPERRRPPARRRPQPSSVLRRPQLPRLRPSIRLRSRGDHPPRTAPHAHRPRRRLLLPHPDERELPPPGHARDSPGRHPARHVPAERGAAAIAQAGRSAAGVRDHPPRGDGRRGVAGARLRRAVRRVERHLLLRTAPGRNRGRAVEHAPPDGQAPRAVRGLGVVRAPGAGHRLHRLPACRSGPDPPVGAGTLPDARHRWLRAQ
jgi:hypothetical protein